MVVLNSRIRSFSIILKVCHVRLDNMTPGIGQRMVGLWGRGAFAVTQSGVNNGCNAVAFCYRSIEIKHKL